MPIVRYTAAHVAKLFAIFKPRMTLYDRSRLSVDVIMTVSKLMELMQLYLSLNILYVSFIP